MGSKRCSEITKDLVKRRCRNKAVVEVDGRGYCSLHNPVKLSHLPNIEDALRVEITRHGSQYRADATILPGTPVVGVGKTKEKARENLYVNLLYQIACDYDSSKSYNRLILKALKKDMDQTGNDLSPGNPKYQRLIGKKCCHCGRTIRKTDWSNGDAGLLVGGSCGPKGKPMHSSCNDRVTARLFRG